MAEVVVEATITQGWPHWSRDGARLKGTPQEEALEPLSANEGGVHPFGNARHLVLRMANPLQK